MNVLKRDLEFLFRSAVAVSALLESSQKLYSIFGFGLKETEKYQNLNGFSPSYIQLSVSSSVPVLSTVIITVWISILFDFPANTIRVSLKS